MSSYPPEPEGFCVFCRTEGECDCPEGVEGPEAYCWYTGKLLVVCKGFCCMSSIQFLDTLKPPGVPVPVKE